MTNEGESTRRWVHLLFGVIAFALPYMDWRVSFLFAFVALLVNAEYLPRTTVGRRLYRPDEGWTGGIVLYPATIAVLILIYRDSTLPVACGWLALGFGDPAAAYFGRKFGGRKLPWNPEKSWHGTFAFMAVAFLPLFLSCRQHGLPVVTSLMITSLGVVVGAAFESLRWHIADNLAIGLSVSAVVALCRGVL